MKKIEIEMPSNEELIEKLNELEKKLDLLTKPKQLDPLLSPKELAEVLGRTTRTLQNWRGEEKGPVYCQFGDNIWYRREDVEDFMLQYRINGNNQNRNIP